MILIYDIRLPQEYADALKACLYNCVFYPLDMSERSSVYASIISHPDIYFFQADSKTLVHAPIVSDKFLSALSKNGIVLIKGSSDPSGRYPETVRYNAVRVGGSVFLNEKHADSAVSKIMKDRGLKIIPVNQGYARCSVLLAGDNAIVTSDEGIAYRAKETGIDALLIKPGHILLPEESHGFIGGASGNMPDGRTVILGDLDLHPDGMSIRDFVAAHGTKLMELKGLPLYDAGSLIFVDGE